MTSHPRTNQPRSSHVDTDGAEPKNSQNPTPRIVVLTGAGISAESGLSTFRDANGLWEQHRIEDVASPVAFANNPDMVHRFYDARRAQLDEVKPNAAHWALARLEAVFPGDVLIITQNVDDLHEAAMSENVLHMHGRLRSALCTACGAQQEHAGNLGTRPACIACGGRSLRPDIVWFGEQVRESERIYEAARNCEIFAVIGTSGVVYPASELVHIASRNGACTVRIDLDVDALEDIYELGYIGSATEMVPKWVREVMLQHGEENRPGSEGEVLSHELIEIIQDFVESEHFGRAYDLGAGHTPQKLSDLLAQLKIPVEKYQHHPAMFELDPLMRELLADDGNAGEGGNRALVIHMLAHSAAVASAKEELRDAQIRYAADLISWLIADTGPTERGGNVDEALNELVTKWIPYLWTDLDRTGHREAAEQLRTIYDTVRDKSRRGDLPRELAQYIELGISLDLPIALHAERDRLIVEFVRDNSAPKDHMKAVARIDEVIALQESFRKAKTAGNIARMGEAQQQFTDSMSGLTSLGFPALKFLELCNELYKLDKAGSSLD